ncbi:hypothetical protein RCL1_003348 [Eukaryota sp. TZLM3-RCL]
MSLSGLRSSKRASESDSMLDVYVDSNGTSYLVRRVDNCLASDPFSILTTLKHPFLLNHFHIADQKNGEIAVQYCPFGSLSDLIQAQHKFSSNDLWCILTQLVYLSDFLSERGFVVNAFTPDNIFVSSICPIHIHVSLFSSSNISSHNVTLDLADDRSNDFLVGLSHSVKCKKFMNTIIDLIRQSNSSTLFSDIEVKLLQEFLSESFLTGIKNHPNIRNCVAQHFSSLLVPKPVKVTSTMIWSSALISSIFSQGILKFKKPLLQFDTEEGVLRCSNEDFSAFATLLINVSSCFRQMFFRAFDWCCFSVEHLLLLSRNRVPLQSQLYRNCFVKTCHVNTDNSVDNIGSANWFIKFPVTSIFAQCLGDIFSSGVVLTFVTQLELLTFSEDLYLLTKFVNLKHLCVDVGSSMFSPNFSPLSECPNLRSLQLQPFPDRFSLDLNAITILQQVTSLYLYNFIIDDPTPLSLLQNLSSLSLMRCIIHDLLPLRNVPYLSYLDLRDTPLSREFRRVVYGRSEVKKVVDCFDNDVFHLDFSEVNCCIIIDLTRYTQHSLLKSLILANSDVANIELVAAFRHVEYLDFSDVQLSHGPLDDISFLSSCVELKYLCLDNCKIGDISPLSGLVELTSLSLKGTKVFNLWPLNSLTKLSTFDVRETLLPEKHQVFVTIISDVKKLVNFYDPQYTFVQIPDTIVDFSLLSLSNTLKYLCIAHCSVQNVSFLDRFINLEYVDLSGIIVAENQSKLSDVSFLSTCVEIKTLFLDNLDVSDLSPLSCLKKLTFLSLQSTKVFDLWPLMNSTELSFLDVRKTFLPPHYQMLLQGLDEVRSIVTRFYRIGKNPRLPQPFDPVMCVGKRTSGQL